MNNVQLQQLQTEEATRIRLNQNVNKLEHQVQHLTTVSSLCSNSFILLDLVVTEIQSKFWNLEREMAYHLCSRKRLKPPFSRRVKSPRFRRRSGHSRLLVPEHKFGHRARARSLAPEVVLGHCARVRALVWTGSSVSAVFTFSQTVEAPTPNLSPISR